MRKVLLVFLFLSSCAWHPCTPEYHALYRHLENTPRSCHFEETPYYVVFLVAARHLDYTNGSQMLKTVARHPSDGSKNSDVGHAWIFLHGKGRYLEGGHTGEFGEQQPRYFEGVMDLVECNDPNPVRYLWAVQNDGCFQRGSGGFTPTFAVKVDLTEEQFENICSFIHSYPFEKYSLTGNQCASFVVQIAAIAGLSLTSKVTVPLEENLKSCHLWSDPHYSQITLSNPDLLEKSMMEAAIHGKALPVLKWYLRKRQKKCCLSECVDSIYLFPSRSRRACTFMF